MGKRINSYMDFAENDYLFFQRAYADGNNSLLAIQVMKALSQQKEILTKLIQQL